MTDVLDEAAAILNDEGRLLPEDVRKVMLSLHAHANQLQTRASTSLERHQGIVRSIYREKQHEERLVSILFGHQTDCGHRYYGERCVWCGVNYLDHSIYDNCDMPSGDTCSTPCPGPPEDGAYGLYDFPLEQIDAAMKAHREEKLAERMKEKS